jgi:stress-induced morphogen
VLDPSLLQERLLASFPDARVELRDLTGGKDHYELRIGSAHFEGISRVARHRLVYAALGEHMKGDIHALALFAYTLDEWDKRA